MKTGRALSAVCSYSQSRCFYTSSAAHTSYWLPDPRARLKRALPLKRSHRFQAHVSQRMILQHVEALLKCKMMLEDMVYFRNNSCMHSYKNVLLQ